MKKVTLLSLVLILLAVSVVPVMAAGGNSNGHGNGNSAGQGNGGGNRDHQKQQDRDQDRNQDSNHGSGGNGNHGHTRMRTPFYLQGTIFALGAGTGTGTVTVTVTHGNAKVKEYIGSDLTVQTNESTMIFQITQGDEISGTIGTDESSGSDTNDDGTPSNRIPITFEQLVVGQKVAIHGNLVDDIFTARLITVYIQTKVEQPEIEEP